MITHLYACKAICSLKNHFFFGPSALELKFVRFFSMLLHFGNINVHAKRENSGQQEVTHGIYTHPLKVYTWNLSDSYLYQSSLLVVSIFTDSAFIFLTFTANIPVLLVVILQHTIISLIFISSSLDVHHFLKAYTVTSGEMCCPAMMLHDKEAHTRLLNPSGWGSKHGLLSRAIPCNAASGDFWRVCLPQHPVPVVLMSFQQVSVHGTTGFLFLLWNVC